MEKRILYRGGILFAVLALVLVLTGCVSTSTQVDENTVETVKLGIIAPMSGDAAAYGEQVQKIASYYLPKLNEEAAKSGKKYELIYEDGKCSGTDSVSAFQKLVDIDGVKFIVGGICSSETLAIAPLTKDGGVLVTSPGSSNPDVDGASPYTFTFSYSDDTVGKTLAKELSAFDKVAVITEQNDFNVGIQKVLLAELKNYSNVTVVADEVFPKGGTDFRSILEKVKLAAPDVVLLNPNPGVTAENLVKQMAELKDWEGYKVFGQFAYVSEATLAVAPEITDGMLIVDSPNIQNEELITMIKAIEAEKGTINDIGVYYTASTIDALNVVTSLINELGENPEAVRNALVSRTFSGYISDNIDFRNSSFPGVLGGVYIVKDGKAEFQK